MARAVNQTVAWITALLLSLIVFGAGLAIVFNLQPQREPMAATGHDSAERSSHGASHEGSQHSAHESEHPADSEHGPAKPKIEHEDPHAKGEGDEDKDEDEELTPASLKAHDAAPIHEAEPQH